jgi:hypothetical protein
MLEEAVVINVGAGISKRKSDQYVYMLSPNNRHVSKTEMKMATISPTTYSYS